VETREHDPREPAASCRGSLGGPPPAWNQPGPPGLAPTQKAPGGNPGTPGVKTTPPSMPHEDTRFSGSNPHRMARGKACNPESPGFRRGLLVPFAHVKPSARLENAQQQKAQAIHSCPGPPVWDAAIPCRTGFPWGGFVHGQLAARGAFPCHLERRSGRLRLASRPT